MNRNEWFFPLVFVVIAGLLIAFAVLATNTQTITAKALTDHECNDEEWHFVINQIDTEDDAPLSIHVVWVNSDDETVPLDKFTGKVAHYLTTSNLDSTVTQATAEIYTDWDGQFNLSHGPCNEEYGYEYQTPEEYSYQTPDSYEYETPQEYTYQTPESYEYQSPQSYEYQTPEEYGYQTPEYATPEYSTPAYQTPHHHHYGYQSPIDQNLYTSPIYDYPTPAVPVAELPRTGADYSLEALIQWLNR